MTVILASKTRKVSTEYRDVHLGVRCTPAQSQALRARAQDRGLTVSTYLLTLALADLSKAQNTGGQSPD